MKANTVRTGKVTVTYMDGSVREIDLTAESKVLEIDGAVFDVFGMLADYMPHERFEAGKGRVSRVAYA